MEIVSYVLEGALEHKDSMGTGSVIRPGDVQRMSAGTGVMHSEFNPSQSEPVHFLQIWILPARPSQPPGYEQKFFSEDERRGRLRLIVSPDGAEGSVTIAQDVRLFSSLLSAGDKLAHGFASGRKGWLHLARGTAEVNGQELAAGDGLAITDEKTIAISTQDQAELLLFDMAA